MNTVLTVLLIVLAAVVCLLIVAVVLTNMIVSRRKAMGTKWREKDLWEDRKRNWLGLPWSFTKYAFDQERFYLDRGIFTTVSDEVRLYRVTDVSLRRTFWQKIIGTGTIQVDTSDRTLHNFKIVNVKDSMNVKELLSETVERQREAKRVYTRENMVSGADMHEDDFDGDFQG